MFVVVVACCFFRKQHTRTHKTNSHALSPLSHHHHHHGGYPIYTGGQSAAATAVSAAAVMPATLSLANESDAASTAASPDDSFSYGMDTYF